MGYSDEFPHLKPLGLYAADIQGDGNCLFNALSDQLYGNQEHNREIRLKTVEWMRDHKDDYIPFLDVLPGGATRRNPKRKNAGGYSSFTAEMPSPEEVDRAFEDRLRRMAQGGTYGDNMEIAAFTNAYEVDVIVVQTDKRYFISGPRTAAEKQICCIAYHMWEHYSSVRNIDGPHSGPPHLKLKDLTVEQLASMETPIGPINIPQWQIDVLMKILWFPIDENTAIRALEDSRGNLDGAVSRLIDGNESPERSDSVRSSSIEPSLGPQSQGDDDFTDAPIKKQDRRMSRASKSVSRTRERQRREQHLTEKLSSSSLEQLEQATTGSIGSSSQRRRFSRVILDDEDTEMEDVSPPPLGDGSTSSDSEYSSMQASPPKTITLKLNLKPSPPSAAEQQPTHLSQPEPRPTLKNATSKKHFPSAREKKSMRKQAQKQAAKERRQAAAKPNSQQAQTASSFTSTSSSESSVNHMFRLIQA